jgi:hypothetical protein
MMSSSKFFLALAVFLLAPNCDLSRRAASEKDKT